MTGIALQIGRRKKRRLLRLAGARFFVGRSAECEVRLASDRVSRRHAALRLEKTTWFVEDLESLNGTFRNGRRVRAAAIRPGDRLRFGRSGPELVVVELDPAPVPAPASRPSPAIPFLVPVAITAGVLTAGGAWGEEFPYTEAAAPVLWALSPLAEALPDLFARGGDWIFRGLLGLWFAGYGFSLHRPRRRLLLGFGLAAVHVVAALAIRYPPG